VELAVFFGSFGGFFFAEGDAVTQDERLCVNRGDAGARGDDAGKVQWIDGGDADDFAGLFGATDPAEGLDGFGSGILLAVDAGDETSAAYLSPSFHAAEGAEDLAPGDGEVLALGEVAEDDAVTEEELLGPVFGEFIYGG
jgi:hypothetical protein